MVTSLCITSEYRTITHSDARFNNKKQPYNHALNVCITIAYVIQANNDDVTSEHLKSAAVYAYSKKTRYIA